MSILLSRTIRLFLDSIGRREEYEYYLERFRADRPGAFALLCPLSAGFEDAASLFAFDLEFLLRLELDPIILLCGEDAVRMRELLLAGTHPFAVLGIDMSGTHTGDPTDRILDFLAECRGRSQVAVLLDPSTTLNDALIRIVPTVSRRVHIIRVQGPLHDAQQTPLYYFHTQSAERVALAEPDQEVADMADRLLVHAPGTHISVASPLQLLQELFTVKGAGCVIRPGSEIRHLTARDAIDEDRLIQLLEVSFGRVLERRGVLDRVTHFYVEVEYRGAALLEPHGDTMYLSKFSVSTDARGEGLAVELWRIITRDHPALFWRSRTRNPVNHWYDKQADGHHQQGDWKIFWRGIAPDRIPNLVAFAISQDDAFAPTTTTT